MSNELDAFVGNEETVEDETVEMTAESQEAETTPDETQEASQPDTVDEKGETGEPPSPAEEHKETMIPLAAKQAEKERRQRAEARARELELQIARMEGQQTKQPEQVPDPYTQPEEYTQYQIRQSQAQMTASQQRAMQARIIAAEEIARSELPDYDKYSAYFAENVATEQPQLIEMMKAAPDPARFAYYKGKAAMEHAELTTKVESAGGLDAYVQSQVAAALEAQQQKPKANIPPDLTSARSVGGDPSDTISEGTDGLNQLLGR